MCLLCPKVFALSSHARVLFFCRTARVKSGTACVEQFFFRVSAGSREPMICLCCILCVIMCVVSLSKLRLLIFPNGKQNNDADAFQSKSPARAHAAHDLFGNYLDVFNRRLLFLIFPIQFQFVRTCYVRPAAFHTFSFSWLTQMTPRTLHIVLHD